MPGRPPPLRCLVLRLLRRLWCLVFLRLCFLVRLRLLPFIVIIYKLEKLFDINVRQHMSATTNFIETHSI